jgi:hypothetical protein
VEVGVTIYCTVPAALLLGLVSVCAIVDPLPAVAPVIPPLIVPIVHVNVDAALAVKGMFVAVALQIEYAAGFVTAGVGLTVIVIVYGVPTQPKLEVGVIIYCTVPAVVLLGLVRIWLMLVLPEPALAPVIPPVIVPTVHANELAVLAVKVKLGFVPLQVEAVAGLVTTGFGFTVITIE